MDVYDGSSCGGQESAGSSQEFGPRETVRKMLQWRCRTLSATAADCDLAGAVVSVIDAILNDDKRDH